MKKPMMGNTDVIASNERTNANTETEIPNDTNNAVIEVSEPIVYSKILPHTTEAGDPYYIGDMYAESPLDISREWEISTGNAPYLAHIKSLSVAWPHLRYLADFMEVGTSPVRWKLLRDNPVERQDRCQRTNVAILDFFPSGNTTCRRFTNAYELDNALRGKETANFEKGSLRLLVVEDLSRSIIETLGSRFDIDPTFFRQHIDDYSWYNIRDRWMDPPNLMASIKHQNWTQVRFVRPRYFKTIESLKKGREESNRFNVFRRPDDDQNNWPYMDGSAVVGLTRTKVSIWISKDGDPDAGITGMRIVLVDPTIEEGYSLWHGYRNWVPTPGMHERNSPPSGPPRISLFEDLIYWISKYPWPSSLHQATYSKNLQTLMQPVLYLTCVEWLIMCQYVNSRLGQIEWELSDPGQFYKDPRIIDNSLERLHTWRRHIPLYKEMITATLQRLAPSPPDLRSPEVAVQGGNHSMKGNWPDNNCHHGLSKMVFSEDIIPDVEIILGKMNDLQDRIDRLASMVVAAISIEDSHRSLQEGRNVARLTWLASVFIPLSFITGLFRMQEDIAKLRITFGCHHGKLSGWKVG
ncbi:magnesium transport [Fusarium sporotrichioides]|uniref:Magnesium transport n=1 Tax=Fusarium sporotrichioides TaxID=5514 RepID=A0A395RVC7_FUSSP|nr:magnesium transport [Fusarium sporotrichioides]